MVSPHTSPERALGETVRCSNPSAVTSTLADDPCILFAMRRESAPFVRETRPHHSFPDAPCWARFCGPAPASVLVVETGIGQPNVARALDWLLARPPLAGRPYRPRMILFAGFAGALTDALHVGDILVAEEVLDLHGSRWPTTWPGLRSRGRLLTTDRLIATTEDKRRLGEHYQAQAVDMESAHFAARCTQADIPFGCVRAVSDEMATPLTPGLASLLAGGTVSPWRLLAALARHPGMVAELLRLARATRRASAQLGLALRESLPLVR